MNSVKLNMELLDLFNEKESEFIKRAIDEWDNMTGKVPPFGEYVKNRALEMYADLYRRN